MWASVFLLTLSVAAALATSINLNEFLERDEIIEAVNNAKTTWVAGRNFDPSLTKNYLKHLLGVQERPGDSVLPRLVNDEDENIEIPETFDARKKWKMCSTICHIGDQGPCGSCWAMAVAAAFSDRLCIATKGKINTRLSCGNLLSCCCGCAVSCGEGCQGGYPDQAWRYTMTNGIVTGGDFHSNEGCQPYLLPACEHHVHGDRKNCSAYGDVPTPTCNSTCYNKKYGLPYDKDIHRCKSTFSLGNETILIQKEIFKHGSVTACFSAYEDFFSYKSGVYQHITGSHVGGHAVRVIGWGVENGVRYWLVANSWNTDWGDNGIFKIIRGTNECGFESDMSGGTPDV